MDCRDPGQGCTLRARIAERAVALRRGTERVDRLVRLVGHVALLRVPLEEGCALGERKVLRGGERAPVLRRRLTVGADGRRAGSRLRSEAKHSFGVTGRVGMVGEAREIPGARRLRLQRFERSAV